jgi:hypothetical protein
LEPLTHLGPLACLGITVVIHFGSHSTVAVGLHAPKAFVGDERMRDGGGGGEEERRGEEGRGGERRGEMR